MVNNYTANFIAIVNYSILNQRSYCKVPYTKFGEKIASLLFSNGYILYYRFNISSKNKYIFLYLKNRKMVQSIQKLKLISKPTYNVYWTCNRLWNELFRSNLITTYILSTSKGIIVSSLALVHGIGGKVLFRLN